MPAAPARFPGHWLTPACKWKPGPVSSADLKHCVALVLENMPLDRLNDNADAAIAHYVRHLGGGLLVTGGRNSYAMGGYYRSYLEDILPVALDRQEELRRAKLAMAIVLDRSGSMSVDVAGGAVKMDLANRGAAEAIALLSPLDDIAVFAVDSQAHLVAPLQAAGDAREELTARVLSIESAGGGIYVYEGLTAAVQVLLKSDAATRHIVLFADAADAEKPGEYQTLLRQWGSAGGSLSVIGLGTNGDLDAALLEDLALLGGGRAYFTADALNLPRVFTQDVMQVARKSFL
ncbi:MAG: VWA domain-containing protein, partial [Gammaproteobacteria bacterium]|nr:VWA domain-containing protein [Gammaproteobacteria bacterium]